ncbi:MAG: porin family protein [Tannerellaceae bacterium]|jgi:outer membrane protein X|nr:porin family protein [Tannerellaceae bacterium]
MKKVFLKRAAMAVLASVTISMTAGAQKKGDMAAGANVTVGTGDHLTNFGLGGKFQYNVTNPIRLEGAFDYFLKKNHLRMWDISVNGHWLFPAGDKLTAYPLAGLGVLNYKASSGFDGYGKYGTSNSDFAFNLGGGLDFKLTDDLVFNAELKYKISDVWSRLLLSAGIAYRF